MAIRMEEQGHSSLGMYGRRLFVLFLLGSLHAYFLWYGDVLRYYAFCGMSLYFLRYKSPEFFLKLALGLFFLFFLMVLGEGVETYFLTGTDLENDLAEWNPPPESFQWFVEAFRGGFAEQFPVQFEMANGLAVG